MVSIYSHFLKIKHLKLKDNCFPVLCWFLPDISRNQPAAYLCPLPLEPPSELPPHPTPLGCLLQCSGKFPLSIFPVVLSVFTLLCPYIPPSPSFIFSHFTRDECLVEGQLSNQFHHKLFIR